MKRVRALMCVVLAATTSPAWALITDPDPTFGTEGTARHSAATYEGARNVTVDSAGRIYVLTDQYDYVDGWPANEYYAIARLTTGGELDPSFGTDGRIMMPAVEFGMSPACLLVDEANERVYLGGGAWSGSSGDPGFAVARFSFGGQLDTAYGTNGFATIDAPTGAYGNFATSLSLQADGRIVAGGIRYKSGTDQIAVARFTTTGQPDTAFGGAASYNGFLVVDSGQAYQYARVTALASGHVLLTGRSSPDLWGTSTSVFVARLTPAGALDTSFASAGYLLEFTDIWSVIDPRIGADGSITLAGSTCCSPGAEFPDINYLLRYTANGQRDMNFHDGGLYTEATPDRFLNGGQVLGPDGKIVDAYQFNGVAEGDRYDIYVRRMVGHGDLAVDARQPPLADAGGDVAVDEGSSVQLVGSGSDPEAQPLTYAWSQTAGPSVTLANPGTSTPSFTAPPVDTDTPLTFRLTVSDGALSATDDIVVTVRNLVAQVPAPFGFVERTGVATSVYVTSETRSVTGFTGTLPISIDNGGQYRIGSGSWTSAAGTVAAGSTLAVRHISASAENTSKTSIVTVGTYTTPFKTTTSSTDRTPDAFGFATQTSVELNSLVESNVITPAGYNAPVSVAAGPGASFRVNGGAWVSSATINPGQTLQTRHTSSGGNASYTKTYVKLGSVTGYFTTRTK